MDQKEYILCRSSLVCGDHIPEPCQGSNGLLQAVEGTAASIGFIPAHQGRPLFLAHGTGPRIGQQVDENLVALQVEQVVFCLFDPPLTILRSTGVHGFDHFYLIGFCVWKHGSWKLKVESCEVEN